MNLHLKLHIDVHEVKGTGVYDGQFQVDVSVWTADGSEQVFAPSSFGPYETRSLANAATTQIAGELTDWVRKQSNVTMKPAPKEIQ